MLNKVQLIGNLGADPEVKYTSNGTAVARISLATSERWKDQERTEWHRVVFFKRVAEVVGEHLSKGSRVYIEGRLQTRKWQDQDGQDRYIPEVVASIFMMLGGGSGSGGSGSGQRAQQQPQPDPEFDDDIPF